MWMSCKQPYAERVVAPTLHWTTVNNKYICSNPNQTTAIHEQIKSSVTWIIYFQRFNPWVLITSVCDLDKRRKKNNNWALNGSHKWVRIPFYQEISENSIHYCNVTIALMISSDFFFFFSFKDWTADFSCKSPVWTKKKSYFPIPHI